MHRTGPVRAQRLVMRRRAIALVLGESVARPLSIQLDHDSVAGDLGEYRCRGHARCRLVPLGHREAGQRHTRNGKSVGQHVPRGRGQPGHCPTHAVHIRRVHPPTIDLGGRDDHHRPVHRPSHDEIVEPLPSARGEQLRVCKPFPASRISRPGHAGGNHQGPGTRTSPSLVHASDRAKPIAVQRGLPRPDAGGPADYRALRTRPHRTRRDGSSHLVNRPYRARPGGGRGDAATTPTIVDRWSAERPRAPPAPTVLRWGSRSGRTTPPAAGWCPQST